jgi:hypothetical protein
MKTLQIGMFWGAGTGQGFADPARIPLAALDA